MNSTVFLQHFYDEGVFVGT